LKCGRGRGWHCIKVTCSSGGLPHMAPPISQGDPFKNELRQGVGNGTRTVSTPCPGQHPLTGQKPLQVDVVRPGMGPKKPPAQGPVQELLLWPTVDPYRPAAQSVQTAAPGPLYLPKAHWYGRGEGEETPAGQAYPAVLPNTIQNQSITWHVRATMSRTKHKVHACPRLRPRA
jgi:hypothetical protein